MAKKAIESHLAWKLEATIEEIEWTEKYTEHLPLEKARVMVGGAKQTTDVSKGLKQVMGHQQARKFYATPNKKGKIIMENKVFDTVNWEAINLSLSSKPQIYKLWYGKQCSGWCGMRNNLQHWDKEADSRCPNCFAINETAEHLMICRCQDRTKLLHKYAEDVEEWMRAHCTHLGIY